MGDGASKTMEERRGHRGSEKERTAGRWGCGGRGEKGSTLREMQEEGVHGVPGESVVVQGRAVMVGIVRRARGWPPRSSYESSYGQDT